MTRLVLMLALLTAACGPGVPASNPDENRTDCYNSSVPPELAPEDIRYLPPC